MPKVVEMMKEGKKQKLELYQEGMEHTEVVIQSQRKKRGHEVGSAEQTKSNVLGIFWPKGYLAEAG